MRKEILAAAAAATLLSNLSVAAELEADGRRTVREVRETARVVNLPNELSLRLVPSCRENFFAALLHCAPQVQIYPPYDAATTIRLRTLWPPRPKPYPQTFVWSRTD